MNLHSVAAYFAFRIGLATIVLFGTLAAVSPANAYCFEPSASSCASSFLEFDDEWEFRRCRSEMESYKSEVETFISCNNDKAQEAADEARRENQQAIDSYQSAVDDFNRRARQ